MENRNFEITNRNYKKKSQIMNRLLKDSNDFQPENKVITEDKHSKNRKGDDYVFKRYRYQQNTILNSQISRGRGFQVRGYDEYHNQNKQNELESYKNQLDKEKDQFAIVDFGDDQNPDQDQHSDKDQGECTVVEDQSNGRNKAELIKSFQNSKSQLSPADNSQIQRILNTNHAQSSSCPQKLDNDTLQNHQEEFDVQPMQLIDFQEEEESSQSQDNQNQNQQEQLTHRNNQLDNHHRPIPAFSDPNNNSNISTLQQSNQSINNNYVEEESTYDLIKQEETINKNNNSQRQKVYSSQQKRTSNPLFKQFPKQQNTLSSTEDNQEQLKGIKIHKVHNQEHIKVEIIDKQLFVSSKIPPGIILKCKLKRSTGFLNIMNPQYDLYLQNGLKHLLSAKKNPFRNRQLFHISTQISNFSNPIRTLMANLLHNNYWLLNQPRMIDKKKISYVDLLIDYKPFSEEKNKTRQMTVLCPPSLKTYHINLQYDVPSIDFEQFKKSIPLQLHYRQSLRSQVQKTSQKNFELVDSDEEQETENLKNTEKSVKTKHQNRYQTNQRLIKGAYKQLPFQNSNYYYLKMQKETDNIFDVQIQHPLTPLQAMAIILTRFDAQLK